MWVSTESGLKEMARWDQSPWTGNCQIAYCTCQSCCLCETLRCGCWLWLLLPLLPPWPRQLHNLCTEWQPIIWVSPHWHGWEPHWWEISQRWTSTTRMHWRFLSFSSSSSSFYTSFTPPNVSIKMLVIQVKWDEKVVSGSLFLLAIQGFIRRGDTLWCVVGSRLVSASSWLALVSSSAAKTFGPYHQVAAAQSLWCSPQLGLRK